MNCCKGEYDDVLDPFAVINGWFQVELASGRIYANPNLPQYEINQVDATIGRLGLDKPSNCEIRARHFDAYRSGDITAEFMRRISPLVWMEANRQGVL
jgi:hypothetical protein